MTPKHPWTKKSTQIQTGIYDITKNDFLIVSVLVQGNIKICQMFQNITTIKKIKEQIKLTSTKTIARKFVHGPPYHCWFQQFKGGRYSVSNKFMGILRNITTWAYSVFRFKVLGLV